MDSDLIEAVEGLKSTLGKGSCSFELGTSPFSLVSQLETKLDIPMRYSSFLREANPLNLRINTPVESIEFIPAERLIQEQVGFALGEDLKTLPSKKMGSWRRNWVVIARSALLGDPYFLDTSKCDAEGDCPVLTAMSGKDHWEPDLAASTFVQFLQILSTSMDVAAGFGEADIGVDDEDVFREALAPRIRPIDPAALRAGHWT